MDAYDRLYLQIADHALSDKFYEGYLAAVSDMRDEGRRAVIEEFNAAYTTEKGATP